MKLEPRTKIAILIVSIVFIIWAGISAFAMYEAIEADPMFCKECHIMDEAHVSWSHSAHKEINCGECHPSTVQGVYAELKTTLLEPNRMEFHGKVRVPGKTCQDCHEKEDPLFVTYDNSLMIYHCTAKDIECDKCHVKGVHEWEVHTNCKMCHEEDYVIQAMSFPCTDCHEYLNNWNDMDLRKESCHACHVEKTMVFSVPVDAHDGYCGDCHKPHIKEKPISCTTTGCHSNDKLAGLHQTASHSDCTVCHVPHEALSSKEICLSCHTDKAEHNKAIPCEVCHKFK